MFFGECFNTSFIESVFLKMDTYFFLYRQRTYRSFSSIYFLPAIFQAITTCLGMMHAGVYDVCLAGGVEFMSDVPIRHSRKMRAWMLASQKQKGPAKMLGHMSKLR